MESLVLCNTLLNQYEEHSYPWLFFYNEAMICADELQSVESDIYNLETILYKLQESDVTSKFEMKSLDVNLARQKDIVGYLLGAGHPIPIRSLNRKEVMCTCPFHEDRRPSFCINVQKNVFNCFSCGRGGDVIKLVSELEHLNFVDTVKKLSR